MSPFHMVEHSCSDYFPGNGASTYDVHKSFGLFGPPHPSISKIYVQGLAKEWFIGCVKHAPAVRGGQDAEITQPRDYSLANPCTFVCKMWIY